MNNIKLSKSVLFSKVPTKINFTSKFKIIQIINMWKNPNMYDHENEYVFFYKHYYFYKYFLINNSFYQ